MQTCPGFLKKSLLEYPGNLLEICSVKSVDTPNCKQQQTLQDNRGGPAPKRSAVPDFYLAPGRDCSKSKQVSRDPQGCPSCRNCPN